MSRFPSFNRLFTEYWLRARITYSNLIWLCSNKFCNELETQKPNMARSRNPIAFTPWPVTFFTCAIYAAIFALLLVSHHILPSAPTSPTPKSWPGVNLTTAWLDLEKLSEAHHPYNSKANLKTRAWLLERIAQILETNVKGDWRVEHTNETNALGNSHHESRATRSGSKAVTVFDDRRSNITFQDGKYMSYFEGDNIMVYIRGSEDDQSDWWTKGPKYEGDGGVLVNAHFDSVSTGFGATDDGGGVISILQLISHFTQEGHQPKKGLLALLNNGEEDWLYGARAFTKHPMSKFPHAFLNLEGAGAGGRATLFRSTDTEVTKAYSKSKYPFGSIVSDDGFKRGLVHSGTDYEVFVEQLGMRGLDVAYFGPRARYHTSEDDARDSSPESLWHMLSAALPTVKSLTDDTSSTFKSTEDERGNKAVAGHGSRAVWFDLFGRAFAVLELRTIFGISIALLVAGPILLIVLEIIARKSGKWYLFASKTFVHSSDDDEPIRLFGWRGFFRFPLAFIISTAAVVALAFLITKVNPYIAYSSEYAVYSMLLCAWLSITWFVMRLGDSIRPSALSRMFTLIWMYAITWILLVGATVGGNNFQLGGGYFMVTYNASVLLALFISYLELFGLPKKSTFAEHAYYGPDGEDEVDRQQHIESEPEPAPSVTNANEGDEADERTSLLNERHTFRRYGANRRREEGDADEHGHTESDDPMLTKAYEGEQAWSSRLVSWTWLLQFLILAPINVILVGQIALLVGSALHQTPADGSAVLTIYLMMAVVSVLLIMPLSPFIHRLKYQVPTIFFLIFVGTLIYTLLAFPFSREARLKIYFVQRVNLDNGTNEVAIMGLDGYVQQVAAQMPSAAGQNYKCGPDVVDWAKRDGLSACVWNGLAPEVVPGDYLQKPSKPAPYPNSTAISSRSGGEDEGSSTWVECDAKRDNSSGKVSFAINGLNTRACRLVFDSPVTNVTFEGAGSEGQNYIPPRDTMNASKYWRLWSREWDAKFKVSVINAEDEESPNAPLTGMVMCQWADVNQNGVIPAFDEVKKYIPVWAIVTKANDGLVEGFKRFRV